MSDTPVLETPALSLNDLHDYRESYLADNLVMASTETYCEFRHAGVIIGVVGVDFVTEKFPARDLLHKRYIGSFDTMIDAKVALARSLDALPNA